METIMSRDIYEKLEVSYWRRARVMVGTAFGIVMCVTSLIQQTSVLGFGPALSIGLIVGALTGIGFGWVWFWFMRWCYRRFFDRVYSGDPKVVGEIPSGREYPFRLPCSLFLTTNVTIGGVLYIGKTGLRFVPHRRFRNEPIVAIENKETVVWAKDWVPSWWGRMFVASGPRIVEIGPGGQRHRFAVPEADVAVPHIRDALGL